MNFEETLKFLQKYSVFGVVPPEEYWYVLHKFLHEDVPDFLDQMDIPEFREQLRKGTV